MVTEVWGAFEAAEAAKAWYDAHGSLDGCPHVKECLFLRWEEVRRRRRAFTSAEIQQILAATATSRSAIGRLIEGVGSGAKGSIRPGPAAKGELIAGPINTACLRHGRLRRLKA